MKRISVIVATYNGELYISEQIKSILQQSVLPSEIIIVDDNSSDNTVNIIRQILINTSIPYKIIVNQQRLGVVRNFEKGIKCSTGDIIFFSDQDDVWKAEKIKTFFRAFRLYTDVGAVISDAEIVNEMLIPNGKTLWNSIHFVVNENKCFLIKKPLLYNEMLHRNVFTGMSMAVRRDIAVSAMPFPKCMLHDNWLGWNSLVQSQIAIIPNTLVCYR